MPTEGSTGSWSRMWKQIFVFSSALNVLRISTCRKQAGAHFAIQITHYYYDRCTCSAEVRYDSNLWPKPIGNYKIVAHAACAWNLNQLPCRDDNICDDRMHRGVWAWLIPMWQWFQYEEVVFLYKKGENTNISSNRHWCTWDVVLKRYKQTLLLSYPSRHFDWSK